MDAALIDRLAAQLPLAEGYRFELLRRDEVKPLIGFIASWFPDIGVGSASVFLRPAFYEHEVFFADSPRRDVVVMLLKQGADLAGMFACERQCDALTLLAWLGLVASEHRGVGLVDAGLQFTETLGRSTGMGLAYGMATLKTPYSQRAFERAGWRLIGITPGYDREWVAPGSVKRVFEAVYAKVLVDDATLLWPQRANLTPRTRAMFEHLFEEPT